MDGLEDKKWFVYLGDHHEGPFSLADVREKVDQGALTQQSYVWAEGMGDWKMMSDVDAFQLILKAPAFPVTGGMKPGGASSDPVIEMAASLRAQGKAGSSNSARPIQITTADLRGGNPGISVAGVAAQKRGGGLWKVILLLFLVIGGTVAYFQTQDPNNPVYVQAVDTLQPYLIQATEKVPALSKYISPIQKLSDVSPEEYADLRAAASTPKTDGPRIAVALSNANPVAPFFYVAGNLPDGAVIDLFVEGEPETLMNRISFSNRVQVVLTQKLGRSAAIRYPDGNALPRGQYSVYAVEGERQPPAFLQELARLQPATAKVPASVTKGFKLISIRNYFLGGPKDATYSMRLKEFHDKLRGKSSQELGELKQFFASLESQLKLSQEKFASIRKIRSAAQKKKQWKEFHSNFQKFESQFSAFFANKPPSVIQEQFFYANLYLLTEEAFKAVNEVHTVEHNSFAESATEKGALEIQLGQASSAAASSLAALKAKIELAEKLQNGPAGMPRRDGL